MTTRGIKNIQLKIRDLVRRNRSTFVSWQRWFHRQPDQSKKALIYIIINLIFMIAITNRRGEVLLIAIPLICLLGMADLFHPKENQLKAE